MKMRMVKVKKGRMAAHKVIKDRLAKKGMRAAILIDRLCADKSVVWRPEELDKVADELRYLAFQIRDLQYMKLATEEA